MLEEIKKKKKDVIIDFTIFIHFLGEDLLLVYTYPT